MNISNRISEIEKEIMFYCREKGVDFIINTSSIEGFKLGKQMGREQREKEIEDSFGYLGLVICALNKFKYACYSQVDKGITMNWLMNNAPCNINDSRILCDILKKVFPEIYKDEGKSISQMEEELKSKLKGEGK